MNPKKICKFCGREFEPDNNAQRYCSVICKTKNNQVNGSMSCKKQYERISGNWIKFCARLVSFHKRQQDGLTKKDLLNKLEEQDYKCALSGIPLTCILGEGKTKTNASVDRIEAGGPYTKDNIQMVCSVLNKFRVDTSTEEFIWWCRKVTEYQQG